MSRYRTPPKVSIITVVYNGEKHIRQCVESIISQEYGNIEFIIIDGKSTDGTLNILNQYGEHIDFLVSEKDRGIYDAMNKGIKCANGDFIMFVNSDDYLRERTAISDIINQYSGNEDLLYGKTVLVDEKMGEFGIMGKEVLLNDFYYRQPISHQSVLAGSKLFTQFGYFDTDIQGAADYDWLVRVFSNKSISTKFVDTIIGYFRIGGLSSSIGFDNFKHRLKISEKYFPMIVTLSYILNYPIMWLKFQLLELFARSSVYDLYRRMKYKDL